MELHPKQMEAVKACLDGSKRIVAVTGPAGTGKTTIIKQVADELRNRDATFAICAPTGKAAKRITEATGYPAKTIHRLLEYPRPGERDPETGKALVTTDPKRDRKNPLDQRVIIADEYAMVNHELDRNLIDALASGARLLVFGDVHQLPPIDSHKIKTDDISPFEKHLKRYAITLEHVFRQAEGSGILESANRIRMGQMPRRSPEFQFYFTDKPIKYIQEYVLDALDKGVNFRSIENQLIVPTRKTWVGSNALNRAIRDLLNHENVADYSLELPRYKWDESDPVYVSVGDKVVCTENTYDMRNYFERYEKFTDRDVPIETSFIETPPSKYILNGETGIITELYPDGSIQVDVGDRIVEIPSSYTEYSWRKDTVFDVDPRVRIELAYALTTHKCQGSEFKNVVYLINRSCSFMLERKNTYTAVTRAREHVLFVTDQRSLQLALRIERPGK